MDNYPELLKDIRDHLAEALTQRYALDAAKAGSFALFFTEYLRVHWGGQYIPKGRGLTINYRDRQIWEEFNGRNISALVHKHKLSAQRIYQILAAQRELRHSIHQIDLFPDE